MAWSHVVCNTDFCQSRNISVGTDVTHDSRLKMTSLYVLDPIGLRVFVYYVLNATIMAVSFVCRFIVW